MSSEEARQIAAGNPLSFLHVSKPEIDLPPATDVCPGGLCQGTGELPAADRAGRAAAGPAAALLSLPPGHGRARQTGLVAAASCEDYLNGVIKKHELTRPDKEDDRVRHIEALDSQTGPVFLVYRASPAMDRFVARRDRRAAERSTSPPTMACATRPG